MKLAALLDERKALWTRMAYQSHVLAVAAVQVTKQCRRARSEWVKAEMAAAAKQAEKGDTKQMWAMLRQVGRRSKRRTASSVAVKLADGTPADTPELVATAWEQQFLQEFSGHGQVLSAEQYVAAVADARRAFEVAWQDAPADGVPGTRQEWEEVLESVLMHTAAGRAAGPDGLPYEFIRASGPAFLTHLARIAHRLGEGAPLQWRGGTMLPVPRKPGRPFSQANSRGVVCACTSAKLVEWGAAPPCFPAPGTGDCR